ncbi:Probable pectinesterase/pectinesterase inhibitor 36 [Striga hermonthica]|uniref:Pectinesterase n=1 Tax=Striga hermonthica TaxID=68872 RepID=A0A9N7N1P4_STRHE|nr:Probable pectinesterase/pectinesterase inhibitor 36 [Striga hermonthica]
MSSLVSTFFLVLLLLLLSATANAVSWAKHLETVQVARQGLLQAVPWAQELRVLNGPGHRLSPAQSALTDCITLYEDAEPRLARTVSRNFSHDDVVTWLSAALAGHTTCLDGLRERGVPFEAQRAQNLTRAIREALAVHGADGSRRRRKRKVGRRPGLNNVGDNLASWDSEKSKADFVVAQDGSGNYRTINEAVGALGRLGQNRPERVVVHVKSGVYREKVEIGRDLKDIMFVGDGIDKTVVTGNQNVQDGATTLNSATFGVSGDGFWARDMTFENTAGPHKHQAVALRVNSDLSVFYRCSFKGYQDTLFVHSLRQFYRECQIHGTIDFIFGDAAAVLQNCDIFVRRPMDHQSNMITAQGRDDQNENTGISILNSRVVPSSEFRDVAGGFKSYLGRPWKKYSRTVFFKTDLDGLVDEKGWKEWDGDFALATLYYAEYMNTGGGASTRNRVRWPGFHVLSDANEANKFAVRNFIGGADWIPATGVPFWADL